MPPQVPLIPAVLGLFDIEIWCHESVADAGSGTLT